MSRNKSLCLLLRSETLAQLFPSTLLTYLTDQIKEPVSLAGALLVTFTNLASCIHFMLTSRRQPDTLLTSTFTSYKSKQNHRRNPPCFPTFLLCLLLSAPHIPSHHSRKAFPPASKPRDFLEEQARACPAVEDPICGSNKERAYKLLNTMATDLDYNRRNKHPRPLSEAEKARLDEFIDSIHYSSRYAIICASKTPLA